MKKLILLIIIVAAIYYGYNHFVGPQANEQTTEPETSQTTDNNQGNSWLTYNNQSYANYSIQYPGDWKVSSENNKTSFTSIDNLDQVNISLQDGSQTISGSSQTIKEISGQQVLVIEGTDPIDGSPAKFIYFNLTNGQKLEINGFGSIFDKMVETLVINSQQPAINKEIDADDNELIEPDEIDLPEENENIDNEQGDDVEIQADDPTEPVDAEVNQEEVIDEPEEFIIKLFYPRTSDEGDDCSLVYGLVKDIDARYNTDEVNTLVSLVQPLDQTSIDAGYITSIPSGTRLRRLDITSGVATADFNSALNEGGGSCMMASRRAQIEQTLLQFPDIEQVVITVDGDATTALQP